MTPKPKDKKRANGEGSVYRRRDGKWVAALSLPAVGGHARRKVKTAPTETQAKAKLRAMHADLLRSGDLLTSAPRFSEWATFWLKNFCGDLKPRTKDGYESHLKNYLLPHLGAKRLDRITAEHVLSLHRWITAPEPDGLGLSPTTAASAHRTLHKMLNDALGLGRINSNPATLVAAPSPAAKEQKALTLEEALHFLEVHANKAWVARYATGLCTGQRQGETLGLQVESIHIQRGPDGEVTGASVETAWALQRLRWQHGCGGSCGRKRGADCPQRFQAMPRSHEGRRVSGGLWLVRPKTTGSWRVTDVPLFLARILDRVIGGRATGFLFTTDGATPMSPEQDYRTWRAWLEEAGLPPMGTHAQRHTASSLLAFFGADEATRMRMLGHTSTAINRRYTHDAARSAQKKAAAQMEALAFTWKPGDLPALEPPRM